MTEINEVGCLKESIEFNEIWWKDVQEGEPICQDEIDLVLEMIAMSKAELEKNVSLITTIESQKEEIETLRMENRGLPTTWAYEQACKAIEKHRQRADKAESVIVELFTVMASAAVTIRDNPKQSQEMVGFLLDAITRNEPSKSLIQEGNK